MSHAKFSTVLKAARQAEPLRITLARTRRRRPRVANLLCLVLPILLWWTRASAQEPAQQPANGDEQANALLARMTLEEKIGQMTQVDSLAIKDMADIQRYFIGSVLSGGSSDPSPDNSPGSWLKYCNEVQLWALKTRLKIPLIYGIDAVHGHNKKGSTHNMVLMPAMKRPLLWFDPCYADLGHYYLRARYLNADTGRFWTADTYGGANADPLSLHRYIYADTDPVNRADPSGQMTLEELNVTVANWALQLGMRVPNTFKFIVLAAEAATPLEISLATGGTGVLGGSTLYLGSVAAKELQSMRWLYELQGGTTKFELDTPTIADTLPRKTGRWNR